MTSKISKRAVPPVMGTNYKPTLDGLFVAVNELSGTIGENMQRAVRVCELLDAGIMRLDIDGALTINKDNVAHPRQLLSYVKKTGDGMTGPLTITGANLSVVNGDVFTYRTGGTTGVIFLNSAGNKYLFNDGSLYQMPTQGLVVGGRVEVPGGMAMYGNTSGLGANHHMINFYAFRWLTYNQPSDRFEFGGGGSVLVAGPIEATAFNITSDRRMKNHILPAEPMRDLDKVQLADWYWTKDGTHGRGVIAQDLREIAPAYVSEDRASGMLSVDKAGLALEIAMLALKRTKDLLP